MKIEFTRQERISNALMLHSTSLSDIGFLDGKTGIAFYFYYLSRQTGSEIHRDFAEELIDNMIESLHTDLKIGFGDGITGIGWAIEHLIQNGFINADADDVLEEFDTKIFSTLIYSENSFDTIISIAYYYIARLCYRIEDDENAVALTLKHNVVLLIDEIERRVQKGQTRYDLGYILNELHKLNVFNFKVEKLQNMVDLPSDVGLLFPGVTNYGSHTAAVLNSEDVESKYAGYALKDVPEDQKWGLDKGIAGIGLNAIINGVEFLSKFSSDNNVISDEALSNTTSTTYAESESTDELSVSIVMSFYRRLETFRVVLPLNLKYFARKGVELIICLDTPDEKDELVEFVKGFPELDCRIIMNPNDHPPRNHAPVLNVGIRHATKKHVIILDPEVELQSDIIATYSDKLVVRPNSFVTGNLMYASMEFDPAKDKYSGLIPGYGSIMVARDYLVAIGGVDESFTQWGGEDDNLRCRLLRFGLERIFIPEAIVIHREENYQQQNKIRKARTASFTEEQMNKILKPETTRVNDENWGRQFNTIT